MGSCLSHSSESKKLSIVLTISLVTPSIVYFDTEKRMPVLAYLTFPDYRQWLVVWIECNLHFKVHFLSVDWVFAFVPELDVFALKPLSRLVIKYTDFSIYPLHVLSRLIYIYSWGCSGPANSDSTASLILKHSIEVVCFIHYNIPPGRLQVYWTLIRVSTHVTFNLQIRPVLSVQHVVVFDRLALYH